MFVIFYPSRKLLPFHLFVKCTDADTTYIFVAGYMLGKVLTFYLILLLFCITITLFATLHEIKDNEFTSYRMVTMSAVCLAYILTLFKICDDAHYISNVVSLY
jgi:hypothetical protein